MKLCDWLTWLPVHMLVINISKVNARVTAKPERLMKFTQLFVSLSVLSLFGALNEENALVEASSNNSNKAALKERLLVEYDRISHPLVVEDPEMSPNPNFDPANYERLLERTFSGNSDKYPKAIKEAYSKGEIDFTYMPKYKYFYYGLLKGCDEVLMKYFKVGTIEKMCKMRLITYKEILDTAIIYDRYATANMMLDYIVEAMLKEIDSTDFIESEWKLDPRYYVTHVASVVLFIKKRNMPKYKGREEQINFYYKYNRIYGIDTETNDSCCSIS